MGAEQDRREAVILKTHDQVVGIGFFCDGGLFSNLQDGMNWLIFQKSRRMVTMLVYYFYIPGEGIVERL